ncbi:alpha/beta hydrolase [Paenibacillus sambharensis]|uniref:Alpha/beta hydrolase n=1 Tax=Paenibacillus sambharensis TaxID=1803190 RepID=A0A2W1LH46_9BACL|nr:alpha/beta hydrolase [Paenibacillus sambharensis]PZD94345.1 alpha/beta hydrolase [Paenibacillus sambharensis]
MPHFHVNGTHIHYHVDGDDGPAVVLIHPPFLGGRIYNYVRNNLANDHRLVTIDVRGHGHSEPGNVKLTMPLIVEDIKQVMDNLEIDEAYICGYSMGSMPVLESLITHPDRFKGGILLSGTSEVRDRRNRRIMKAADLSSRLKAKEAIVVPLAMGNADSRTTFHVLHKEGMAGNNVSFREYANVCLNYSCKSRLRAIASPMLLLCGEKDETFIKYAREMDELLAVSELYAIKGADHQLPTHVPDKVCFTIRQWIAKHEDRELADTYAEREELNLALTEQGIITENDLAWR